MGKPFSTWAISLIMSSGPSFINRRGGSQLYCLSDKTRFYPQYGTVEKSGLQISLSHKQCVLLQMLLDNANTPVSSLDLATCVWHAEDQTTRHLLYASMNRLRNRIGPPESQQIITIRGYGYIFNSPFNSIKFGPSC